MAGLEMDTGLHGAEPSIEGSAGGGDNRRKVVARPPWPVIWIHAAVALAFLSPCVAFALWLLLRMMSVVLMVTVGVLMIVEPDNIERWAMGLPVWHNATTGLLSIWIGLTLAALPLIWKMRLNGRSSGLVSGVQTTALVVSAVLWALLFVALADWQRSIAAPCEAPALEPRSGLFAPCPKMQDSDRLPRAT